MKESINSIINELTKKLSSLDEASQKSYAIRHGYNTIVKIFDGITITTIDSLQIEDIVRLTPNELEEILRIVGKTDADINKIVLKFNPNKILFEGNTNSAIKQKELREYFDNIRLAILGYVNRYSETTANVAETFENQRNAINKYLRILTDPNNTEVLEPNVISEMETFLANNGVPAKDRSNVLGFLNKKIIDSLSVEQSSDLAADVKVKVENLYKRYSTNNEYMSIVTAYVDNESIDVDQIPSIAIDLCTNTELSIPKMNNTLIAYLAAGMYSEYAKENDANILNIISDVLKFEVPDKIELLSDAREIVNANKALYMEALNNNENIDEYVDTYTSTLIDHGYSLNEAIDKKCLPFVVSLSKLIDKMDKLETDDPEYKEGFDNIKILVDLYNEQQAKKTQGKRIA